MLSRIKFNLSIVSIFTVVFACTNIDQNKISKQINDQPVVLIHGIKGGILKDKKSQDIKWLNLSQSLNLDSPNIKLPLEWSDTDIPKQSQDNLVTGGVLDKITMIPNLIEVKVYHNILEQGTKKYTNFYPFSYDWRRSNLDSLENYLTFLRQLKRKHNKPVKVIAHSMGGLLTMAAMQREPELFESVFFAGVPFAGGVGFLKDLHTDLATGLNKKLLSPEVLASMPSVYSLFPIKSDNELSDGKNIINVDFFNSNDWQKLKIGPFAYPFSNNDQFKKHFSNSLKVAKIFRQQLTEGKLISNGKLVKDQPKVFVILAKTIPSMTQVIHNGPKSILNWDFESAPKELGDGLVSFKDAYPPQGLKYTEFESKFDHGNLLNDQLVLDWIFSQK